MSSIAELRKEQILEAAVACFTERGFHKATIDEICKLSGISPGSVYRYFKSKDDIIEALVIKQRIDHVKEIRQLCLEMASLPEFSEMLSTYPVKQLEPKRIRLQIEINAETARNPKIAYLVRESIAIMEEELTEFFRLGQQLNKVGKALEPRTLAKAIIVFFQGIIMQKILFSDLNMSEYSVVLKKLLE